MQNEPPEFPKSDGKPTRARGMAVEKKPPELIAAEAAEQSAAERKKLIDKLGIVNLDASKSDPAAIAEKLRIEYSEDDETYSGTMTRPILIRLDPAKAPNDTDPEIAIIIDYGYFDEYDKDESGAPKFKHESTKAFVRISDGKVFMENYVVFDNIDIFKNVLKKDHLKRMRNHPSYDPDPISPTLDQTALAPPTRHQKALSALALQPHESLFMLMEDSDAQKASLKPPLSNPDILWNFLLPFATKGNNPITLLVTCDKSTGEISIRYGEGYRRYMDYSSFLRQLKKDEGVKIFIIHDDKNKKRETLFVNLNNTLKEELLKKTACDVKRIEELLIKGAEIDKAIVADGKIIMPFLYAVSNCTPEVIDLLIEYGALNKSNMLEAFKLANNRTSSDPEGNAPIFGEVVKKIKAFCVSQLSIESVNLGSKELRSDNYIEIIRDIQARRRDPWYSQNLKRPHRLFLADDSRIAASLGPEYVRVVAVCDNGMGGVAEIKGQLNILNNSFTTWVDVLDMNSGVVTSQTDHQFDSLEAFIDFASTDHLAILRADPRYHEASSFVQGEIDLLKWKKLGANRVMLIDHGKSRRYDHHDFSIITTDVTGKATTEMVEFDPVTGTIKRASGAVESYKTLFDNQELAGHKPYTTIDRFKEKVDSKVKNLLEQFAKSHDQNAFLQLREEYEEFYAFINVERAKVAERHSKQIDVEYNKIIEDANNRLQAIQNHYNAIIEASIKEIQEKQTGFRTKEKLALGLDFEDIENVKKFYTSLLRKESERLYHTTIPAELDARYKATLENALKDMKEILTTRAVSLPKVPHPKISEEDVDIETGTLFSTEELAFLTDYIKEKQEKNQTALKNVKLKRGFSGPNGQGKFDRIQNVPALVLKNGRKLILRYSLNFDENGNCFAQYTGKDKHLLGKGSYGRVKIGQKLFNADGSRCENKDKTTDEKENRDKGWVAIKVIQVKEGTGLAEFDKEREFWDKLKELKGVTRLDVKQKNYLMTSLYELSIAEYQAPRYSDKIDVAISAAKEIGRIHKSGIIHCDIKGANMMVNPVTKEVTGIDYGFALHVKDPNELIPVHLGGSPLYFGLEAEQRLSSAKTDIFAYGVMLIRDLKLFEQEQESLDPKMLFQSLILVGEILKTNSRERPSIDQIVSKLEEMKAEKDLTESESDKLQSKASAALLSLFSNVNPKVELQEVLLFRVLIGLYSNPFLDKSIIFDRKLFRFTARWDNLIGCLDVFIEDKAPAAMYHDLFPNLAPENARALALAMKNRILKERDEVNGDYKNIYAVIPDHRLESRCDSIYNALYILNASTSDMNIKPYMLDYWKALKQEQSAFTRDFKRSSDNLEILKKTASTIENTELKTKYEEVIKDETRRLHGISTKYRTTLHSLISGEFNLMLKIKENRNQAIQNLVALATPFFSSILDPGSAKRLEAYLDTLKEERDRPRGLDLNRWMGYVIKHIPTEHLGSWMNICNVVAHPELLQDKNIAEEFPQISAIQPVAKRSPLRVVPPPKQAPTTGVGQPLNWLHKVFTKSPPKERPEPSAPPSPTRGRKGPKGAK